MTQLNFNKPNRFPRCDVIQSEMLTPKIGNLEMCAVKRSNQRNIYLLSDCDSREFESKPFSW